jgi:adenylate kinase
MNIVVLGQPGVGKGTYTDILAKKYKIPHISTGDMFREEIKKDTEFGRKVRDFINNGELVSDELTISMLKKRLSERDSKKGFFLDGFPRTIPQAETLEKMVKIDKVLNFVAPEEVIIDRLSGRRICKKCGATYHIKHVPPKVEGICDKCGGEIYQRKDDMPEAIRIRTKEYMKKTNPLIDFYRKRGLLVDIDASPPIEEARKKVIPPCEKALSDIEKK